jgi:cyclic beta-1,2-glucan synthetase
LAQQLELHYLRNPEPGLLFALLSDFQDANSESSPEDEDLVRYAQAAIANLNAKYASFSSANGKGNVSENESINGENKNSDPLFYFFHRKRIWNPSERKWLGT